MKDRDLRDLVHFSEEGPRHASLYEADHLWSEIVCIQGAQGVGPISDLDSDAVCVVVAGRVAIQVDRDRKKVGQWHSVLVPAGSSLSVRNASPEPAVLLIVAAPPPTPRAVSE